MLSRAPRAFVRVGECVKYIISDESVDHCHSPASLTFPQGQCALWKRSLVTARHDQ
jgi:hypothetical protein